MQGKAGQSRPYFGFLDRDFQFQLTAIGGPGRNLDVAGRRATLSLCYPLRSGGWR